MRILFVNHTSEVSGAERSLLDLLAALPAGIDVELACPPGDLDSRARRAGISTAPLRGVEGGPRVGLRSSEMVAQIAADAITVRALVRSGGFDLVHANSLRAGLVCCQAKLMGGAPVVCHVRDCLPPDEIATRLVRVVLARFASCLVFNSRYTEAHFVARSETARRAYRSVVYSGVAHGDLIPQGDAQGLRGELGLPPTGAVLATVAQMTPWKGQDDAVRILAELRRKGHQATLLLVGSPKFVKREGRFDHLRYLGDLKLLVERLGLSDHVRFLGERSDVPRILECVDALLVPSWEEPFGRVVVEAMMMERLVFATDIGGPKEIITDGVDGFLLPPRTPRVWADAVAPLLEDPDRSRAIGRAAKERAIGHFDSDSQAGELVSIYERLASPGLARSASAASIPSRMLS